MALTAELVKLCERPEPDPGPGPDHEDFAEEDYHDVAAGMLLRHGNQPIWVFAYGSLLWKPAAAVIETRAATAHGWHRAFCLEMKRWRGSPAQPGLMMGLRRGGQCEGAILRLPDDDRLAQLMQLLRREIDGREDLQAVRMINVQTAQGPVQALAFWAEPRESRYFANPGISETARILARACGHLGSGASYLYETVTKLEELGIRDHYLWELQQLVAKEIMRPFEGTDASNATIERQKALTS
ncbi:MAG: gamma-glutamylcyclotransferase [Aestuariivirga sp.]|nr:gamma-glutamylcyclotransferase [Aestuariivirga sp.]